MNEHALIAIALNTIMWTVSCVNLSLDKCGQRRAHVFDQMRTAKALIRLRECAVWSGPSLPANRIRGHYRMYLWTANARMKSCACVGWILICILRMKEDTFSLNGTHVNWSIDDRFIFVVFFLTRFQVSILHKSIAGRSQPVRVADGPITVSYRFM